MIYIQRFDIDDELDEVKAIDECFGSDQCARSILELDGSFEEKN
jgi:hypothetical protein